MDGQITNDQIRKRLYALVRANAATPSSIQVDLNPETGGWKIAYYRQDTAYEGEISDDIAVLVARDPRATIGFIQSRLHRSTHLEGPASIPGPAVKIREIIRDVRINLSLVEQYLDEMEKDTGA